MISPEAFLFDLDGVLLDTEPLNKKMSDSKKVSGGFITRWFPNSSHNITPQIFGQCRLYLEFIKIRIQQFKEHF